VTPVDTSSLTTAVIAQWGAYGVILIVMVLVVVYLVRRIDSLGGDIKELQLGRLNDAKEYGTQLAGILVKNSETNNRLADGMEAFGRVVEMVKR